MIRVIRNEYKLYSIFDLTDIGGYSEFKKWAQDKYNLNDKKLNKLIDSKIPDCFKKGHKPYGLRIFKDWIDIQEGEYFLEIRRNEYGMRYFHLIEFDWVNIMLERKIAYLESKIDILELRERVIINMENEATKKFKEQDN